MSIVGALYSICQLDLTLACPCLFPKIHQPFSLHMVEEGSAMLPWRCQAISCSGCSASTVASHVSKIEHNQAWHIISSSSGKCFASARNPNATHLSHLNTKSFTSYLTQECSPWPADQPSNTDCIIHSQRPILAHSRQSKPTKSLHYHV